ncbi:hypothetical protein BOTBODRAFT_169880 [Botryobasidium botryosum FD-172 SS1]|uniref:Uncharacterized protein n=1 Tax=Botryobasidium botryosum (strain FD-172 SS1) TaxID=930990 RepID=A0A067MYT8_BOTB1|nr:hypothetical protein BOTBODRAFT_169880 [Botryobasidium botryosum FD-172 SS1]
MPHTVPIPKLRSIVDRLRGRPLPSPPIPPSQTPSSRRLARSADESGDALEIVQQPRAVELAASDTTSENDEKKQLLYSPKRIRGLVHETRSSNERKDKDGERVGKATGDMLESERKHAKNEMLNGPGTERGLPPPNRQRSASRHHFRLSFPTLGHRPLTFFSPRYAAARFSSSLDVSQPEPTPTQGPTNVLALRNHASLGFSVSKHPRMAPFLAPRAISSSSTMAPSAAAASASPSPATSSHHNNSTHTVVIATVTVVCVLVAAAVAYNLVLFWRRRKAAKEATLPPPRPVSEFIADRRSVAQYSSREILSEKPSRPWTANGGLSPTPSAQSFDSPGPRASWVSNDMRTPTTPRADLPRVPSEELSSTEGAPMQLSAIPHESLARPSRRRSSWDPNSPPESIEGNNTPQLGTATPPSAFAARGVSPAGQQPRSLSRNRHSTTSLVSVSDPQRRGAPHSIHGRKVDIVLPEPLAPALHPRTPGDFGSLPPSPARTSTLPRTDSWIDPGRGRAGPSSEIPSAFSRFAHSASVVEPVSVDGQPAARPPRSRAPSRERGRSQSRAGSAHGPRGESAHNLNSKNATPSGSGSDSDEQQRTRGQSQTRGAVASGSGNVRNSISNNNRGRSQDV